MITLLEKQYVSFQWFGEKVDIPKHGVAEDVPKYGMLLHRLGQRLVLNFVSSMRICGPIDNWEDILCFPDRLDVLGVVVHDQLLAEHPQLHRVIVLLQTTLAGESCGFSML